METSKIKFKSIEEYIAAFPAHVQLLLEDLRNTIKQAAPKAEEVISYNMPAFKQSGVLVYFAGYKNHIGFYPTSSGVKFFYKELAGYKTSKGAIQFPFEKKIPVALIKKIVKFRVKENAEKASAKRNAKKKEL